MNFQIPDVIPGDWTRMAHIVRQIRRSLGTQASLTFSTLTLDDLTASRLAATDANKKLVSSDLVNWVTGTANRVTVSDDTNGGVTLTAPQDLHTGATPQFAGLTLTGDLLMADYDITCDEIACVSIVLDHIFASDYVRVVEVRAYNDADHKIVMDSAANTMEIHPGDEAGDSYVILESTTSGAGNPMIYPSVDGAGYLGTVDNTWARLYANILADGDGTTVTPAEAAAAYTHIGESGASHTYIDQAVTVAGTPQFANLGIGTAAVSTQGINIKPAISLAAAETWGGVIVQPTVTLTGNAGTVSGLDFTNIVSHLGANYNLANLQGVSGNVGIVATSSPYYGGTITTAFCFRAAMAFIDIGHTPNPAVTDAIHLDIPAPTISGVDIGTHYGIKLGNMAGATTNWAIYSAGGDSSHAGNFRIGSNVAPTVALDVTGEAIVNDKIKMTSIGGYAIKLTNTTGVVTVKGQTVKADPTTDDAVILTAADDTECIGVFLDAGIADDAEAWVVVAGIADVAMGDDELATAGNWVETNSGEAGYADATANSPAASPQHFNEIGHCIETVAAGGGGTHILARCVLHFN